MEVEHKLKIQSFFCENKAEILNVWRLDIGPKDVQKTGQAFCLPSDQSRSSWPFQTYHLVSLTGMGPLRTHALLIAIYGLLALCSGSSDDEVIAPILKGNL